VGLNEYISACLLFIGILTLSVHDLSRAQADRSTHVPYLSAMDQLEIGDTTSAIKTLRTHLRKHPDHEKSIRLYMKLLSSKLNKTNLMNEIKRQFERFWNPQLFLEIVRNAGFSPDREYQLLKWGITHFTPNGNFVFRTLGKAYQSGNDSFVQEYEEAILSRFPRHALIVQFYAHWYARRGSWNRARDLFRTLVSIRPGHPGGYRGLAAYYRKRGMGQKSSKMKERARALEEDSKNEPLKR